MPNKVEQELFYELLKTNALKWDINFMSDVVI